VEKETKQPWAYSAALRFPAAVLAGTGLWGPLESEPIGSEVKSCWPAHPPRRNRLVARSIGRTGRNNPCPRLEGGWLAPADGPVTAGLLEPLLGC